MTKYGHIKHYALLIGLPLTLLETGLEINFRSEDNEIGYVIMCQIFIAVGGGTIHVLSQVVIMAAASQDHFPSVFAVLGIVVQIGKSVGGTVSTAIWTDMLPKRLAEYLPSSELPYLA